MYISHVMLNDEKQDYGNVTLVLRLLLILELKNVTLVLRLLLILELKNCAETDWRHFES